MGELGDFDERDAVAPVRPWWETHAPHPHAGRHRRQVVRLVAALHRRARVEGGWRHLIPFIRGMNAGTEPSPVDRLRLLVEALRALVDADNAARAIDAQAQRFRPVDGDPGASPAMSAATLVAAPGAPSPALAA